MTAPIASILPLKIAPGPVPAGGNGGAFEAIAAPILATPGTKAGEALPGLRQMIAGPTPRVLVDEDPAAPSADVALAAGPLVKASVPFASSVPTQPVRGIDPADPALITDHLAVPTGEPPMDGIAPVPPHIIPPPAINVAQPGMKPAFVEAPPPASPPQVAEDVEKQAAVPGAKPDPALPPSDGADILKTVLPKPQPGEQDKDDDWSATADQDDKAISVPIVLPIAVAPAAAPVAPLKLTALLSTSPSIPLDSVEKAADPVPAAAQLPPAVQQAPPSSDQPRAIYPLPDDFAALIAEAPIQQAPVQSPIAPSAASVPAPAQAAQQVADLVPQATAVLARDIFRGMQPVAERGRDAPATDRGDALRAISASGLGQPTRAASPIIAPTAAQAQIPLDTNRADWFASMIDRIGEMRAHGSHSAEIRLLPDALGTVDVRIEHQGERVNVTFTADNAHARALLTEAAPRLAEMADARGLRLGQTEIAGGHSQSDSRRPAHPQPETPSAPASAFAERDADVNAPDDRIA